MNQAALTAWIAKLNPGDTVGIFNGGTLVFVSKVIRRTTTTDMIICEPGGTFKASGYPHGRLADQSLRLRPIQPISGLEDGNEKNPDGFGFTDVCGDAWKGYINLFWKDYPLALVPPPLATEIRAALILARQLGNEASAATLAAHLDSLPSTTPALSQSRSSKRRQQVVTGQPLLIANRGTRDELTITALSDGTFQIDNVYSGGSKSWVEFPRPGKTIAACKATATRIFGEPQVWEEHE